jgi:hypothetical protein
MKHLGVLFAAAAIMLGSCQKPPQAESDAALAAFETAASNPDAVTYAPDSLRAAQEKLDAMRAELDAQARKGSLLRNYDAATVLARDAKSAAEKALTDATRTKGQVKSDAESLFAGFATSIPEFEGKVWAARRVRGIKLDADIPTLAEASRAAVVDAEKDFQAGSYAAAKAKALTVQERLRDGETRINEAIRLAKAR